MNVGGHGRWGTRRWRHRAPNALPECWQSTGKRHRWTETDSLRKRKLTIFVSSIGRSSASIAGKYCNRGIAFDELRSAGLVGLVLATKKFDPDRGVAFGGTPSTGSEVRSSSYSSRRAMRWGLVELLRSMIRHGQQWMVRATKSKTSSLDGGAPTITVDLSSLNGRREGASFSMLASEGEDHSMKSAKDLGCQVVSVSDNSMNAYSRKSKTNTPGNAARHAIRELFSRHQVRSEGPHCNGGGSCPRASR